MIIDFFFSIFNNQTIAVVINSALPLGFVAIFALFAVYLERKVSAFMQDRLGPNRVGPIGLFQTLADILKLIQKEDIVATDANRKLFNLSPVLVFAGSYAAFAAIPFSSVYIGANIELGLIYIVSVSGFVVAGILLGGWASNNKYSLLGAMRSAAQVVSYEIPTVVVILTILIITGTLNLQKISELQYQFFQRTTRIKK